MQIQELLVCLGIVTVLGVCVSKSPHAVPEFASPVTIVPHMAETDRLAQDDFAKISEQPDLIKEGARAAKILGVGTFSRPEPVGNPNHQRNGPLISGNAKGLHAQFAALAEQLRDNLSTCACTPTLAGVKAGLVVAHKAATRRRAAWGWQMKQTGQHEPLGLVDMVHFVCCVQVSPLLVRTLKLVSGRAAPPSLTADDKKDLAEIRCEFPELAIFMEMQMLAAGPRGLIDVPELDPAAFDNPKEFILFILGNYATWKVKSLVVELY